MTEALVTPPEASTLKAPTSGPDRVRKSRRAGRSGRAGRTILEHSGLPRPFPGQPMTREEAAVWDDYVGSLADSHGLPRPVPKWSTTHLRRAGRAQVKALRLEMQAERDPDPKEARRLRSEARRYDGKAKTAEHTLAKLVERMRKQHGPVSLKALARA